MKKIKFFLLVGVLTGLNALSATSSLAQEKSESMLMGPSAHLAVGIRMKKAPDLDTYYSTVGGIKVSLLGIQAGSSLYLALAAPGLYYAGYGIFAPVLSPIIFYHTMGIGFAVDFFPVRADRRGGPVGMSFNFDVMRLVQYFTGAR